MEEETDGITEMFATFLVRVHELMGRARAIAAESVSILDKMGHLPENHRSDALALMALGDAYTLLAYANGGELAELGSQAMTNIVKGLDMVTTLRLCAGPAVVDAATGMYTAQYAAKCAAALRNAERAERPPAPPEA